MGLRARLKGGAPPSIIGEGHLCAVILVLGLCILIFMVQVRQVSRVQIVTEHVVRIGVLNGEHMRVLGVIAVDGVSTNHAQNNSHAKGPGYGRGGLNQREDNE